jgi:hypothetical protein
MAKTLHEALSAVLNGQVEHLARKPKATAHRPLPGGQSTARGTLPKSALTGEARPLSDISEAGQTLGKVGGKKGGPARAKVLPAARRSEIAREGGLAAHGK